MNPVPSNREALKAYQEYLIAVCGLSQNTVIHYTHHILRLLGVVEDEYTSIQYQDFQKVIKGLNEEHKLSAYSQHLMISAWRSFYSFLQTRDFRADNPTEMLELPKMPKKLPKWIPEEEMNMLLGACLGSSAEEMRLRAIVFLLYASGMRVSELTSLRMADWVGREKGLLRVTGKGGKTRIIPIGEEAETVLNVYIDHGRNALNPKGSDFIFPSPKNKDKPLTRQRMFQMIKELGGLVGVEVSAHKLRHSCATHMLEHGADLSSVQSLLGHSQLQTTEIYTDVLDDTLRKALEGRHPLSVKVEDS